MCALWTKHNTPIDGGGEVLKPYLPRNLSNSDTSLHPQMRRLYAWTDPPPLHCCSSSELVQQREEESSNIVGVTPRVTTTSTCGPPSPRIRVQNNLASSDTQLFLDDSNRTGAQKRPASVAQTTTTVPIAQLYVDTLTNHISTALRDKPSPLYQENELQYYQPKRSSSLKTKKTPPGTPGAPSKMVRFADAFGLDLESVRHVFNTDCPPKIPTSAIVDLHLAKSDALGTQGGAKHISLCFTQPSIHASFRQRVLERMVVLEQASVEQNVLNGTVRVRSVTFRKAVLVRITFDSWTTFTDIQASYIQDSYDGTTDRFSFAVVIPQNFAEGDKAHFAIRYNTDDGRTFWDNNNSQNYTLECFAKSLGGSNGDGWLHFL